MFNIKLLMICNFFLYMIIFVYGILAGSYMAIITTIIDLILMGYVSQYIELYEQLKIKRLNVFKRVRKHLYKYTLMMYITDLCALCIIGGLYLCYF